MSDTELISFDYAIKYLLKHKSDYEIVEGFISSLLEACGHGAVKIRALLESESNKERETLKKSIADLVVEDEQHNKYIVEIDRAYTNLFMHKACFNSSRLIVDSISSNEDYSTIKKIFHINLLYFPFDRMQKPLYHGQTIFREVDQEHPIELHLEDMGGRMFDAHNILPEYFIISIPLFNDVIKEELDDWLYVLKYSKVREGATSPYMKKVAERLNILTMPPEELAKYHKYRNSSLKERDYLVSAEEKGKTEGREEGAMEKSTEIAMNMLKEKLDHKLIAQVTGLSVEQVTKLANKQ